MKKVIQILAMLHMIIQYQILRNYFIFIILSIFLLGSQVKGFSQSQCGTDQLHQHMLATDPEYKLNMEKMEKEINSLIQKREKSGIRSSEILTIPIVVHIIHLGEQIGIGTNISDSLIHEAIRGLNERWRNLVGLGVDMQIEFCLAKRDPNNLATSGINRVNGADIPNYINNGINVPNECSNGADEKKIKDLSIWPVADYYNIWIVNKTCNNNIGGYAKFPFMSQETDGTVIAYNQFTYDYYLIAHELAHGFNLFHTFQGDIVPPNPFKKCPINNNCEGEGDRVCDTPPHKEQDCGNVNPCSSIGNWSNSRFNYLSYCQPKVAEGKFTEGQKDRVYFSILASRRRSLLFSQACEPPISIDLTVTKVDSPLPVVDIQNCPGSDSITPTITIKNLGSQTIQNFNLKYKINENFYKDFIWTDGNLMPGKEINISLKKVPIIQGSNSLTVYTTSPNGLIDEFNKNDTLVYNFKVNFINIFQSSLLVGDETCYGNNDGFLIINNQAQTEIFEDFENSPDWIIENIDQINRWIIGNEIAASGNNSIYISNDNKNNTYTPNIQSIVNFYKDFDFPSDVLNISLEFDWRSKGVSCSGCLDFGSLVVYNLPNDYPLPNEFNLSDVSNPTINLFKQYEIGKFANNNTFQKTTINIPISNIGKRRRIVFSWQNAGSSGNQPPASVDNITLIYKRANKPPYNKFLNGIELGLIDTIFNLSAGQYTLDVINSDGCINETEFVINQPEEIVIDATVKNSSCYNLNDGSLNINISGGKSPYKIEWSNDETMSSINNLNIGKFNVTVTDHSELQNKLPKNACLPKEGNHQNFKMGIYSVKFNTINNISLSAVEGNKDFTEVSTTVKRGESYTITVQTGPDQLEQTVGWIDFNNNGIFEDSEQILNNKNSIKGGLHIQTVVIPLNAIIFEPLRMRIASDFASNPSLKSCMSLSSLFYGQYEDYTIFVGSPCIIEKTYNINFNHPVLLIQEGKCNEQNCELISGEIKLQDGQCSDLQKTEFQVNDGLWQDVIPVYDNDNSKTIAVRYKIDDPIPLYSEVGYYLTNPSKCPSICNCPDLLEQSKVVEITNSICDECNYTTGKIMLPSQTICPDGSSFQVSIDMGASWLDFIPDYDNLKSMKLITRCSCDEDSTKTSPWSEIATTEPSFCPPECNCANLTPNIIGTDTICQGQFTTLTASGGNSYLWSNQNRSDVLIVNPSITTTYSVTVTNEEGCTASTNIIVIVHPNPSPEIVGAELICFNGQAELIAGPNFIDYKWSNDGGSEIRALFSNIIEPITYYVTVTDSNLCQGTDGFEVSVRQQVSPIILGHENLCTGEEIVLSTSEQFLEYEWSNDGGFQPQAIFLNVIPGNQYMVTVTDSFGCSGTNTVTIEEFKGLSVLLSIENTSCGIDNGSIKASIATPGNFNYHWSTMHTNDLITELSAGVYTVTVTDDKACLGTATATILSSDELILTKEIVHTSCGLSNGFAQIIVEGGTGYRYLWNDGYSSEFKENMAPGRYTITVTANGECSASTDIYIEDSQSLSLITEVVHTTCGLSNGSIRVIASDLGLYDYLWSTGDSDPNILGLQDGDYTVSITDRMGCFTVLENSILPSSPLQVDILGPDVICEGGNAIIMVQEGLSYTWNTGDTVSKIQVPPGEYSVTVTDILGCTTVASKFILTLLVNPPIILGPSSVCLNKTVILSVQENDFIRWNTGQTTNNIEVIAGTYSVTVTDVNGCSSIASKIIDLLPNPIVVLNGANEVCEGEVTPLTATGGQFYTWSTGATTSSVNVGPGVYSVTATNEFNCSATLSTSIFGRAKPNAMIQGPKSICSGQSATLLASGGISYSWNTGAQTATLMATPSVTTTYTVTVTNSNGCTDVVKSTLKVNSDPVVQASDVRFSAVSRNQMTLHWKNGDGVNRLVVARANGPVISKPTNGFNYIANQAFGLGSNIGFGEFVVYNGTDSTTIVTNLIENNTYHFRIFEYGCLKNYLITNANGNPANQIAKCLSPPNQSTTISFSLVSTNQFTANWTNGNGSRRVVKINTINNFTPPSNGTDPSANPKYAGSGQQVVYNGNGSSVTITGLIPNQTYWVRVYEANCDGINSVYNITSTISNPNSQRTRTVLPSVQSFTASNVIFDGNNIIDISSIFTTNKPYDTHPPIDIYVEDNNKTRFTLNASYAAGFSFQLVDQLTIVTDGTMAINPSVYGSLEPVTQTSNSSMYMDYIHPAALSEEPYLDLKLKLLFEEGLVGMSIPIHIYPSQSPLPVEMSDISVKHNKLADINELTWTTKSEVNNDYFDIERSFEREVFQNIGKVDGMGNSSSSIDYIFNDRNIPYDGTYIYRLKQVDMDGKATTSKLVSVTVSRAPSVKTGLFPNPSTDIINCYVDAYVGAEVNIEVFNNLGQLVSQQNMLDKLSEARMTKQLEGKTFGKGIFTVVFTVDGIRYNHKLIMIE